LYRFTSQWQAALVVNGNYPRATAITFIMVAQSVSKPDKNAQ
jgi:hypothetical protein